MATITRRGATEEDLLNTPDDGIYELVDGEIRSSPGGVRHDKASMALVVLLGAYVKKHRLGHVLGPDTGHRLPSGNVRSAVVYRSPTDVREIGIDEYLDGGEVVLGFRCRLGEIL